MRRLTRAIGALAVPCCWSAGLLVGRRFRASARSPVRHRRRPRKASPSPSPSPTPSPDAGADTHPGTAARTATAPAADRPADRRRPVVDGPGDRGQDRQHLGRVAAVRARDADIVYVEQVEGGLTRLMAVYHSTLPGEVGAVRSVRTTDAELLPVFGVPALVFSGGGGGPLDALAAHQRHRGLRGRRRRPVSGGRTPRRAPYNLHANVQSIASSTGGLSRRRTSVSSSPPPTRGSMPAGPATSMSVQFQAARVGFAFEDGRYRLIRGGEGQSDANGAPIVTDNVLLQNVAFEPDGEVDSVGSPSYHLAHRRQRHLHPVPGRSPDRRDLEPAGAGPADPVPGRRGSAGAVQTGQDLGGAGSAGRLGRRLLSHGRTGLDGPVARVEFRPNQAARR